MVKTMRAAVLHAPGDLRIEEHETSPPGGGEVQIGVRACGICGSDIDRIMKSGTYRFPLIPGHEFSGEVVACGKGVTNFARGDRVIAAPLMPCFQCDMCQGGYFGQCERYDFLGSRSDGAFAQYVNAPARNVLKLDDRISFREAAMIEPAAVTLHGLMKAVAPGDCVAVLGCGAIGLFAVQLARLMGAGRIIAADIDGGKLELAKELGADDTVDCTTCDAVTEIRRMTGGADTAVETAGSPITQEQCLRAVKKQGKVLYIGTAHKDVILPAASLEAVIRGEIRIFGAWNSYSAPFPGTEWRSVMRYIAQGGLNAGRMISHVERLENLPLLIKSMANREFPFVKVVLELEVSYN